MVVCQGEVFLRQHWLLVLDCSVCHVPFPWTQKPSWWSWSSWSSRSSSWLPGRALSRRVHGGIVLSECRCPGEDIWETDFLEQKREMCFETWETEKFFGFRVPSSSQPAQWSLGWGRLASTTRRNVGSRWNLKEESVNIFCGWFCPNWIACTKLDRQCNDSPDQPAATEGCWNLGVWDGGI